MSTMRLSILLLSILCGCVIAADDPKQPEMPNSPLAVTALKEHEKTIHDAEDACRKAQVAADRKLIDKLKLAMTVSTKAGNLPEANAIDAQIKLATARIDAPKTAPTPGASRGMAGQWNIRFNTGGVRTYGFRENGDVEFMEEKLIAHARHEKDAWILDFGDGKPERVKFVDGELHIEHFEPGNTFPLGKPRWTAVGTRLSESK